MSYNKRSTRTALLASTTMLLASGISGATIAQDAAVEEEATVETITVTGSRIVRTDLSSVSPITVTSSEEIKLSGFTRVEDLMNSLPQVEAAQTSFIANGASGTASLDLRGLGTSRTLVLVNGRRLQPGGIYSQSPDINQIPSALVERAEVLTGGASSTYGSDAIAGVVNFIMKKDFEGIEINAGIGGYQHNNNNAFIQDLMDARGFEYPTGSSGIGGKSYNIDVTMGGDFADGKGHATVYATWRKNDELRQGSRDYSSCALNNAGDSCGGSFNAIIPNFDMYPIDPATGNTIYGFRTYTQNDIDDGIIADPDLIGELFLNGLGEVQYTDNDGNDIGLPWANPGAFGALGSYGGGANKFLTLDPGGSGSFLDPFDVNGQVNRYNYAPVNHFMRPDQRFTGGAFIDYEINDMFKPYVEVSFMHDRTVAQIAESGTFFAEEYVIPCDSQLLSAQQVAELCTDWGLGATDSFAAYIGKRNVEGGPRASNLEHMSYRMVIGTNGALNDSWTYDASVQYGSTSSNTAYINDFFAPRITEALDDACRTDSDCIPYEAFTLNGITPESARPLTGVAVLSGITKEYIANAYATGDLGVSFPTAENPIAVVIGAEYRKEVFERTADEVFDKGLLLGQGGTTKSITGSYEVKEVFAEAIVPLVEGAEFAEELSMEFGARYSDYDTSGGDWTYKIGMNWAPVDMVKIRASYARSVRGANVAELFSSQSTGLWNGTDPCGADGTVTTSLTAAQCANTGLSAAQYGAAGLLSPASQYNGLFGGNPDLEPEIGKTFTVGAVISPTDSWNISVDYWDIKLENVIGSVGAELTVQQCGETGLAVFCDNVNRAPNGSLWLGTAGFVRATNINLASRRWKGIDVASDFAVEVGKGTLTGKLVGSYQLKKEYTPLPGVPSAIYDCSGNVSTDCFAQPKWRHSMRLAYTTDSWWTASVKWRYFGKVNYEGTTDLLAADGISAQSYIDLVGAFEVSENVAFTVGVNNVFDKEPPMVGGTLSSNANTVAGFYDTLGRYLHANVTFSF